jgi:hypothetical protein
MSRAGRWGPHPQGPRLKSPDVDVIADADRKTTLPSGSCAFAPIALPQFVEGIPGLDPSSEEYR